MEDDYLYCFYIEYLNVVVRFSNNTYAEYGHDTMHSIFLLFLLCLFVLGPSDHNGSISHGIPVGTVGHETTCSVSLHYDAMSDVPTESIRHT